MAIVVVKTGLKKFVISAAILITVIYANRVVSAAPEGKSTMENTQNLKISKSIKLNTFSTFKIAFSEKKGIIAVLGFSNLKKSDFIVSIYNTDNWKLLKTLSLPAPSRVSFDGGLEFSRDGRYLAAGIKKVVIWNTDNWSIFREINGPFEMGDFAAQNVQAISFDAGSNDIAILYNNVWWPQLSRIDDANALAEVEHKKKVAISDNREPEQDNNARVFFYNINAGTLLNSTQIFEQIDKREIATPNKKIIENSLSDTFIVAGMYYGGLINGVAGTPSSFISYLGQNGIFRDRLINNAQSDIISDFSLSHNAKLIATAGNNGNSYSKYDPETKKFISYLNEDKIRIWDSISGKLIKNVGPPPGYIRAMSFSSDDTKIIACHNDPDNKDFFSVWSINSGLLLASGGMPSRDNSSFLVCGIIASENTILIPVFTSSMINLSKEDELYIIKF